MDTFDANEDGVRMIQVDWYRMCKNSQNQNTKRIVWK
ncbi:hypothetical protein N476_10745 [Pseudoalteromonas luteoviolacea H33]|uniref:Uncharacterized protein n=1 Tax=Pseudoalteromonas luteoviolacea H33 TaxID=1365251 RepID=A0A167FMZ3_9GAMM|nr:hypothetical protein N476_10745 [Pseudoalteromonas luteoviolacea H33]KZN76535.1 hypothetical protein N477_15610 [Pseudoalteromonas luteoviolacea H33-S]